MDSFEVLFIAVGLAMDAFAVAIGIGCGKRAQGGRAAFRLSFHFGLFQFFMPILGWFAGSRVAYLISSLDHWIAFGLLGFVGVRMIQSGLDPDCEEVTQDPSRGRSLIMLSIATSIDAFAVGLSLAMLQVDIITPCIIIGIVAASFTLAGLLLGGRLGDVFGKRMEIIGGLILIGIGLRVLLTHLGIM